jgi:hypothetical protein
MGNYTTDSAVKIALSKLIDPGFFRIIHRWPRGLDSIKKHIGFGWLSLAIFLCSKINFSAFIAIFSFMR